MAPEASTGISLMAMLIGAHALEQTDACGLPDAEPRGDHACTGDVIAGPPDSFGVGYHWLGPVGRRLSD